MLQSPPIALPVSPRKVRLHTPKMLSSPTLESAPLVISEQQITLFKFYREQSIREGMMHGKELYGLAREFNIGDRLKAYQFGCELMGQGAPTLISVSKQRYIVWISLRSHLATVLATL